MVIPSVFSPHLLLTTFPPLFSSSFPTLSLLPVCPSHDALASHIPGVQYSVEWVKPEAHEEVLTNSLHGFIAQFLRYEKAPDWAGPDFINPVKTITTAPTTFIYAHCRSHWKKYATGPGAAQNAKKWKRLWNCAVTTDLVEVSLKGLDLNLVTFESEEQVLSDETPPPPPGPCVHFPHQRAEGTKRQNLIPSIQELTQIPPLLPSLAFPAQMKFVRMSTDQVHPMRMEHCSGEWGKGGQ